MNNTTSCIYIVILIYIVNEGRHITITCFFNCVCIFFNFATSTLHLHNLAFNKRYSYIHDPPNVSEKFHTVGTIPKSNIKTIDRCNIDPPSTQIHDRSQATSIPLAHKYMTAHKKHRSP